MRRVVFVIGGILLAGAVCSAQQQAIPLNKPPAQPPGNVPVVYVTPPMPTEAAIDSLGTRLSAEILARKMTGVVVVGLSGPDRRITELGVSLRGRLSDSVARESTGVKVPNGDAIRDSLAKNRIAEDMIYSNALGGWIAKHMHADGYVTARINTSTGNGPTVTAELFDCTSGVCTDSATFNTTLILTPEELEQAGEDYVPTLKMPVVPADVDGVSRPKCLVCPMPDVPPELRIENIQGSSHLLVTVLPDGTADDVFVVGPMGHGLDTLAADAVLTWKFSPAHDAKDIPVATQTEIEIPFKIEGVPVKIVKKK
jgi:TonB family protein